MRELLRIAYGTQDTDKSYRLRDYNMEVYAGEILYIQGLAGSGIKGLLELLQGGRRLTGGQMYIDEELVTDYAKETKEKYGIYTITSDEDLVTDMTVAENLEVVRYHPLSMKLYRKRRTDEAVANFLREEKIGISPDTVLNRLDSDTLPKLSMLKAKMHGARLIVLDLMEDNYGGRNAEEIRRMIQKLREEGTSFLLLSERYSMFAEMADRIQLIHQGRDLMEWHRIDDGVRNYLKSAKIHGYAPNEKGGYDFIGFFDYEWKTEISIWDYLERFQRENPLLFDEIIDGCLPEKGKGTRDKTVVIPRESSEQLVGKLSISDNIILTIPDRIGKGHLGCISLKLKKSITDVFYRKIGIPDSFDQVKQLSRVQRKILSVYRYEIARPKVILFENPYWGMDVEEIMQFRSYVEDLSEKGIRVIFFSKALDELEYDCGRIFLRKEGGYWEELTREG
ncbi:ABC transporter family protein [Kineothrix alysoides]|uniref:ABC transporter family protein n=1 Tax=Kineothrix alysoides TaxID=1469948 RepID=A0A4R1QT71_9FIRM|nr:ATP-binding cassette domain-containing protein [Kineothrix alysoides]TCL56261.1 ABC transporter family protein [Kineothrix alysoides]